MVRYSNNIWPLRRSQRIARMYNNYWVIFLEQRLHFVIGKVPLKTQSDILTN